MTQIAYHEMPDGRRIAFRHTPGAEPTLVFLPGYMSDMAGSKACAVFDWAAAHGRACLLLDYSGCGQSSGSFADGTLSRWREEVLAVIEAQGGEQATLIGSSMGGWLMLLVGLALGDRLAGLVGIAPAPDFIDWGLTQAQQANLAAGEIVYEDNAYGYDPTPTHPGFYADALGHILLSGPIELTAPVRLLHGQRDADVPWETSLRLADAMRSDAIQVTLVKDGDHRLSRESDIALLIATIASFPG